MPGASPPPARRAFVGLSYGAAESETAWRDFLRDLGALVAHLYFPVEHRLRVRHTNLLERTFGESRRRVKVIGRLPGEESCVSLVWAVLDRASRGWRGLTMTPEGIRLLQDLRRELFPTRPRKEVRALRREAA
ncbi:MAG: transposase [Chloroflexota bacterium]|nr:transposase [Chloroflexota bacterium]